MRDYVRDHRGALALELGHHARLPDERAAVEAVASWRGAGGKVQARQRRMPRVAKEAAGRALRRARFAEARTFEALLRRVHQAIGGVRGVGEVTVYDAALRIGAQRGLLPGRVRLHATARESAALLGLAVARKRWLEVDAFPTALRGLAAWELERFLSSYRQELEHLAEPRLGASLTLAIAPYLRARAARLAA